MKFTKTTVINGGPNLQTGMLVDSDGETGRVNATYNALSFLPDLDTIRHHYGKYTITVEFECDPRCQGCVSEEPK